MTNLEKLWAVIKEYRSRCEMYDREYVDAMKQLESGEHEGSLYFEKEAARIAEKKADDLRFLRKRIAEQGESILADMEKAASREQPEPPTQEMLDALNLAKMRESMTAKELQEIADLCRSNALAYGVVMELARKHNLAIIGKPPTVGNSTTFDAIDTLRNHLLWTMRLDVVNHRADYYKSGAEYAMNTRGMRSGDGTIADPDGALKAYHDRDLYTVADLCEFCGIKDVEKFTEATG